MSQVKIFSTPTCIYCFSLKEFLKQHNIVFEDIDISKNEKVREEIIAKTGQMVVPIIEIDGQIIIGFDREKIIKLLNIKE